MEISTFGAYTDGINIWLPSADINALFHQTLTGFEEAKYLCSFEGIESSNAWKIGNVLCFEKKLFFFSQYSYVVWIFDLYTQKMKKVKYYERKSCFIPDIVQVGNDAWIMPRSFDSPVIIFNLSTGRSEQLKLENGNNVSDKFSFTYSCEDGQAVYFATRTCGNIHICKINCVNREVQYKSLNKIKYVNCLTVQDGNLYILALNNESKPVLIKYNTDRMTEERDIELSRISPLWNDATMFYFRMLSFKNSLIMLPGFAEEIVIYNTESKQESSISLPGDFLHGCKKRNMSFFSKVNTVENYLYFFPYAGIHLLVFDMCNFKFELKKIACDEEAVWKKYGECRRKAEEMIEESVHIAIHNYLNYILSSVEDKHEKTDLEYGTHIYDIVKGKM